MNRLPRRLDTLTRQVSRVIKLRRDEVATQLLPQMGTGYRPATVVYCNYLLNSCARAKNITMAKEVYRFMERSGLKMNDVSYGCFLRTLCRSGQLDDALELLDVLERSKGEVKANLVMYNTVLNGCSLAKSKAHADRCLMLMDRQSVAKDELSYVELIKLSGLLHDARDVLRWWEDLASLGPPSPSSRCTTIIALCRSKALPEAITALAEMSSVLSSNDPFHLLPGKKRRPPKSERENEVPISEFFQEGRSSFQAGEISGRQQFKENVIGAGNVQTSLKGFHNWEVRKELPPLGGAEGASRCLQCSYKCCRSGWQAQAC